MVRMIPATYDTETSPGEKALFESLKSLDCEADWVVLHSLQIAEHVKNVGGEADFVILVPGKGVVVLEVKSHESLKVEEGMWHLGKSPPTHRSPFRQAKDAMFSLRGYLKSEDVNLTSLPFVNAAWFTHLQARSLLPESAEWHEWQVLDMQNMNSVKESIEHLLDCGIKHLGTKYDWFDEKSCRPTIEEVAQISGLLRPRFEIHPTMTSEEFRASMMPIPIHSGSNSVFDNDRTDESEVVATHAPGALNSPSAPEHQKPKRPLRRDVALAVFLIALVTGITGMIVLTVASTQEPIAPSTGAGERTGREVVEQQDGESPVAPQPEHAPVSDCHLVVISTLSLSSSANDVAAELQSEAPNVVVVPSEAIPTWTPGRWVVVAPAADRTAGEAADQAAKQAGFETFRQDVADTAICERFLSGLG